MAKRIKKWLMYILKKVRSYNMSRINEADFDPDILYQKSLPIE
jgi:hypothetical protein